MGNKILNLGCGGIYEKSPNWVNLDFTSNSVHVQRANLLSKLAFEEGEFDGVYSSHFLEHIPYEKVPAFLLECFRVLKPGGMIRLVLPNFEEMCVEYLRQLKTGDYEKANFVVIEIIDQCVRQVSGGELGKLYSSLHNDNSKKELKQYICERTGADFTVKPVVVGGFSNLKNKYFNKARKYWINFLLSMLPLAFRQQNVTLTEVGESHKWLWDFYQIKSMLEKVGFSGVEMLSHNKTNFPDKTFSNLDINSEGLPRKGIDSMFIEARK